jgi:hypothetical protein
MREDGMAWSADTDAVPLYYGTAVSGSLTVTLVGALRHSSAGSLTYATGWFNTARMYGVEGRGVANSLDAAWSSLVPLFDGQQPPAAISPYVPAASSTYLPTSPTSEYIGFVQGVLSLGSLNHDRMLLRVDNSATSPAAASYPDHPVRSTSVPRRVVESLRVVAVTGFEWEEERSWEETADGVVVLSWTVCRGVLKSVLSREFAIQYQDYLMLTSRYVMDTSSTERATDNSIGDIVAFWSSDPDFGSDTRGPYLIVDSLDALPGVLARLWLGVPSGVVVNEGGEDYLLVYYQCQSCWAEPTLYLDSCTPGEYSAALRQFLGDRAQSIGVKRIHLSELMAVLDLPILKKGTLSRSSPTWQAGWTPRDAVTGKVRGPVLLYVAAPGSPPYELMDFVDYFQHTAPAGEFYPVLVDPCALACDDVVHLFAASVARSGSINTPKSVEDAGRGIWHFSALDNTVPYIQRFRDGTSDEVYAEKDVAFVASLNPGWGDMTTDRARDWVAIPPPIGANSLVYQDPDVILLADGTVRVSFGVRDDTTLQLTAMRMVTGLHDDACRTWEGAWLGVADTKSSSKDGKTPSGDLHPDPTPASPCPGAEQDGLSVQPAIDARVEVRPGGSDPKDQPARGQAPYDSGETGVSPERSPMPAGDTDSPSSPGAFAGSSPARVDVEPTGPASEPIGSSRRDG